MILFALRGLGDTVFAKFEDRIAKEFDEGVAKAIADYAQVYPVVDDDGSEISYLIFSNSSDDDAEKVGDDVEKAGDDVEKAQTSTMEHAKAPSVECMSMEEKNREGNSTMQLQTEMSVESRAVEAVTALLQLSHGPDNEAVTTSPNKIQGVWELYVRKSKVEELVASVPLFSVQEQAIMATKITEEHGTLYSMHLRKLCVMEVLFKMMAATEVQDTRILPGSTPNKTSYIVEAVRMPCDGLTTDCLFFSKDRAFAVHDPLQSDNP